MRTFIMINAAAGSRKKLPGGFTLIELIAVAAIIGLLTVLTVRGYAAMYRGLIVEKAAKDMVMAAKYARVYAIEKQRSCALVLDSQAGKFFLSDPDPEQNLPVISNQYIKAVEFSGRMEFELIRISPSPTMRVYDRKDKTVVLFNPDGTADAAVLQIGNGKNHFTIYIQPATGKARVESGPVLQEYSTDTIDLEMQESPI